MSAFDLSVQAELQRAASVDLVTLPPHVAGTNCGNCMWIHPPSIGSEVGYCAHPAVRQPVTARMCCALWDAVGVRRAWLT